MLKLLMAPVIASLIIQGCVFGKVTQIDPISVPQPGCDLSFNVCGIQKGASAQINVWGEDVCSVVKVHFGDGDILEGNNVDFGKAGAIKPWTITHVYSGWPGPKTISVEGITNCVGTAVQTVHVFQRLPNQGLSPEVIVLALTQPASSTCTPLPSFPLLRSNTMVSIVTPDPTVQINFGCAFNGCIHNADGEGNSHAPSSFPFPGLRKYSLILRVGTQVVQGGTNVSFTSNQAGPLEICVNDDNLGDNTGGWGIDISVDESQAL